MSEADKHPENNPGRFDEQKGFLTCPAPRHPIEHPIDTAYNPGYLVKILIGPATGKIGLVVIERNGNYKDSEPASADDGIGVQVIEPSPLDGRLLNVLESSGLARPGRHDIPVLRWFDGPEQLELIRTRE